MAYNLKDIFYLGATDEYPASTYGSAGIEGNIPIDVSAYVDPIAKGRQRGQGLAVYKVHCQVAADNTGTPQISTDAGAGALGLTVKPYTTSGHNSSALQQGDLTPESDLLIYGAYYTSPATRVPGQGGGSNVDVYCEPSEDVPYVVVRDTIFQIFENSVAMSANDSYFISYRLECAMITLDSATLNQLLRTQTA
jgi:hypothetical protein